MNRRLELALFLLAMAGCKAIAGIEDRKVVVGNDEHNCEEYCTQVSSQCRGDQKQYQDREQCLAFCAELFASDSDRLECRDRELIAGEVTCSDIGPTGRGMERCEDPCDLYCETAEDICGEERASGTFENAPVPATRNERIDQCKTQCEVLRDDDINTYSVAASSSDDTLSCRFAQLASAAAAPEDRCFASTIYPFWKGSTDGEEQALNPCRQREPEQLCEDYCRVVNFACTAKIWVRLDENGEDVDVDYQQYEDTNECLAVCNALEPGTIDEAVSEGSNTASCRLVHAYNVLAMGISHCAHAGPGGATVCDDPEDENGECDGYCKIVGKACPDRFDSEDECIQSCRSEFGERSEFAFSDIYSVNAAQRRGGMQCRLRFAIRALVASKDGEGDLETLCTAATDAVACKEAP